MKVSLLHNRLQALYDWCVVGCATTGSLSSPAREAQTPLLLWLQRFRALAIGRSRCSRPARTSNANGKVNDNGRQLRCFAAALAVEAAHRAVARAAAVP